MRFRPLFACVAALWLAGCGALQDAPFAPPSRDTAEASACPGGTPDFADPDCLLEAWVAFGLASQRGDREWRADTLGELEGGSAERRLARAVVLGWGDERQWDQAAELYKADLAAAPVELQPLLRYWLNELEGRRRMASRLEQARGEREKAEARRETLEERKAALTEKLEALTAIEQSINLRHQSD